MRRLVRSLLEHQGGGDLRDDATLVMLHWVGPPPAVPQQDRGCRSRSTAAGNGRAATLRSTGRRGHGPLPLAR